MANTPGELLAEISHSLALAQVNLKRAFSALEKYETSMGMAKVTKTHTIRCVQVWQDWLAANGPNTRKHITEVTGVKLTERATPHTVVWDDGIDPTDDVAFPANTLMRVRSLHEGGGRGAPPVIYFLWSQRWDVHPLFGVGPVPSDGGDGEEEPMVDPSPIGEPTEETVMALGNYEDWTLVDVPQPVRYGTLEEWDDAWASTFDGLVAAGTKPSDEIGQRFRETLPVDADGNAAIAIAYRNAVVRARSPQTLLGVIQPEPDRSGWTMVGNHNHLPHPFGEFCALSRCQRIDGSPPA